MFLGAVALSAGLVSMAAFAGDKAGNIPFPGDFRGWTHTKSVVTTKADHPLHGFRNIYVNDIGIQAMKTGGTYPDGSVIVMSFHKLVQQDSGLVQGGLIKYVLMQKDRKLTSSDGWAYEAYKAGEMKPLVGDKIVEKCHGCHTSKGKSDFVFSKYVQ
ncbi:MAG: cytochrome P460 family protein [Methyloligellaceae bacterium]